MKPLPRRTAPRMLACTTFLLIGVAAPSYPLQPGKWTFTNVPGVATLDGRRLHDLPVGDATSETACLTVDEARAPARWLARDIAGDCTLMRQTVSKGRVDITGRCAPRDEGQPEGTIAITGYLAVDRYDLRFTTIAYGENGIMSFRGKMTGHRIGMCPAT